MTIAVNLFSYISIANRDFVFDLFTRIAASEQTHQFIFIVDKKPEAASLRQNVLCILSAPKTNTRLFRKVWYNYTLPAILKKQKAALLINADGICSLRTSVPQVLFINEHYGEKSTVPARKTIALLQKNMDAFLTKARFVVCGSQVQATALHNEYKVPEDKIKILYPGGGHQYQPLEFEIKEAVKDRYTEGKEYFLFNGRLDQNAGRLINLLKAFSFFKKRQKSNMQFVLLTKNILPKDVFVESLKTYKYRDDILLLNDLPEHESAAIVGAAYAFVYPLAEESFPVFPSNAIQCEVPLLLHDSPWLKELAGEAAIYSNTENFEDIANKMMWMFKDETGRAGLIKHAANRSKHLKENAPEDTMSQLIESIAKYL